MVIQKIDVDKNRTKFNNILHFNDTYKSDSGVHPTLTRYSIHGYKILRGVTISNSLASMIWQVLDTLNSTNFKVDFEFEVPARGNLHKSGGMRNRCILDGERDKTMKNIHLNSSTSPLLCKYDGNP